MRMILPSAVDGSILAPPSKSMMVRAVAAAALARGQSKIMNASFCDDAKAALSCARALGATVDMGKNFVSIRGGGNARGGALQCNESGLCMRMFAPICALRREKFTLAAHGSLRKRPVGMVARPLETLGVRCRTAKGFPPIVVQGPIQGGNVSLDASESSQFLTGLLMALPMCAHDSEIRVANLQSKPYVGMTLSLLSKYGIIVRHNAALSRFSIRGGQRYKPTAYCVEGDWSGAAFLLVAGAIAGNAGVAGLDRNSLQADKEILVALRRAGAKVAGGKGFVIAGKGDRGLRAFEFDATDCPDLFPCLAVLACCCRGKSRLLGVKRLRHKESDRAAVIASELGKLGAKIQVKGNVMEIEGGAIAGGAVDSHNDHRIAMAGAVAALISQKGVRIINPECVSKSYPGFFGDLKRLAVEK